jgi:predicted HicB family RNase H-like nuclease
MIRIDPGLHRKAATRAEAEDLSLSAWIAKQIEAA